VAILCLSCLGLATSSLQLVALFVVGGIGIAAFHPEAAASAGALLPEQRSRAMAIFTLCGYLARERTRAVPPAGRGLPPQVFAFRLDFGLQTCRHSQIMDKKVLLTTYVRSVEGAAP